MNILDIIKRTVKSFPGSYEGLGAALGMSPNVLRNKVSRSNDTHHLSVSEAMEIMEQAKAANVPNPLALLGAMAAEFDMVLVPAGQRRPMGDMSLAEQLLAHTAASHRLGASVVDSIRDGQVSEAEMAHIEEVTRAATQADLDLQEAVRTFTSRTGLRSVG